MHSISVVLFFLSLFLSSQWGLRLFGRADAESRGASAGSACGAGTRYGSGLVARCPASGRLLDAGGWQVASHQLPATFALRLDRTAGVPSELVLDLWYQATTAHQVAVQLQDETGASLAQIATLSGEGEGASCAGALAQARTLRPHRWRWW